MRTIGAIVLATLFLPPLPAAPQQAYAGVLLQYLTGDADAAIAKASALEPEEIRRGVQGFETTRSRVALTGAAALHTEAAIRGGGPLQSDYHLLVATAIVEFGEDTRARSNSTLAIHPKFAAPVSDEFRRLWYCTVITALENGARLAAADGYLRHAVVLYPDNPEVQLLAGIAEELRSSPRTADVSAGARRKALQEAERHYRAVLTAAPDRLEARLRLGRVLQEREQFTEARDELGPLTRTEDSRLAYLAWLFLGGIEDASRNYEAAVADYAAAVSRLPAAQTARLAASELQHRLGDRRAAAAIVSAAAGEANVADPWWTYGLGEHWRIDILVAALRGMRQA